MDIQLFSRSLYALCVVGLLLFALWWAARTFGRGRLVHGVDRRLMSVIETITLSQHATAHIVRVGTRYFLIGGGSGGVNLLSELENEAIDVFVQTQREIMDHQVASMGELFKRFRGKQ